MALYAWESVEKLKDGIGVLFHFFPPPHPHPKMFWFLTDPCSSRAGAGWSRKAREVEGKGWEGQARAPAVPGRKAEGRPGVSWLCRRCYQLL